MNKVALLSFDLEEFDIPEEYGQPIADDVKFAVSLAGVLPLLHQLQALNVRATFFVTANFALHHSDLIRTIAKTHEIASHGFYHATFDVSDLRRSKAALESIVARPVQGFRMARLQPVSDQAIAAAGYTYHSSMNPTYLPGRYNNLGQPRTVYDTGQLLHVPVSVTPWVRFPLFWLSFKNLPLWLYQTASWLTLNHDRYLNLYFHPWEFADLTPFRLPGYVKRYAGPPMLIRLERYLTWLTAQADLITFSEFGAIAKRNR